MEITLNEALSYSAILLILVFLITLKLGGASIIADPSVVERIGYCKNVYGENFHLSEKSLPINLCYQWENASINYTFTNEEFRDLCPKHNLTNLRFFSQCFRDGGSRMDN